jgi:hypothetical protein
MTTKFTKDEAVDILMQKIKMIMKHSPLSGPQLDQCYELYYSIMQIDKGASPDEVLWKAGIYAV